MWALKQRGLVPDAMNIVHMNGSEAKSMVCSTQSNSPYVWMRYEHVRDGVYERVCMCLTLRPESQSGLTYKPSISSPPPLTGNILFQNKARENNYSYSNISSLGHTPLLQTIGGYALSLLLSVIHMYSMPTFSHITKLFAHYTGIHVIPEIITHCAPHLAFADLNGAL